MVHVVEHAEQCSRQVAEERIRLWMRGVAIGTCLCGMVDIRCCLYLCVVMVVRGRLRGGLVVVVVVVDASDRP